MRGVLVDLTGRRIGMLTILRRAGSNPRRSALWECKCDCGTVVTVASAHLLHGETVSCGCKRKHVIDLAGQRFGRLTVLSREGSDGRKNAKWRCRCDCGVEIVRPSIYLREGHTASCGCIKASGIHRISHGLSRASTLGYLWNAYSGAKARCENPNTKHFHRYGGRGIQFRFKDAGEFAAHLGPRPTPQHSVDRINPDGHYELGNVRWADKLTQGRNKSKKK